MYTTHGLRASGSCYKVQLVFDGLELACRWVAEDTTRGKSSTKEFPALNANAKIPGLQLADGRCLAESNAITCSLADATPPQSTASKVLTFPSFPFPSP